MIMRAIYNAGIVLLILKLTVLAAISGWLIFFLFFGAIIIDVLVFITMKILEDYV